MISKDEVKHIAKLAHLELTEKETVKIQKDLSVILDYFDLLKKAPKVAKINLQIPGVYMRKDEVVSSHDIRDELIASAPDKKEDYIKVKAIF